MRNYRGYGNRKCDGCGWDIPLHAPIGIIGSDAYCEECLIKRGKLRKRTLEIKVPANLNHMKFRGYAKKHAWSKE